MRDHLSRWRAKLGGGAGLSAAAGGVAVLVVCAVLGTAWWTARLADTALLSQRAQAARCAASLVAAQTDLLLRVDDISGVRRQMLDVQASGWFVDSCRVSLAGVGVIASSDPSEIGVMSAPEQWAGTQPVAEPGADDRLVRVPFEVPGRGVGVVEVGFSAPVSVLDRAMTRAGVPALVAVAGFWIVFIRVRKGLAALTAVGSALGAVGQGERRASVLTVGDSFGPLASSWNTLLQERESLDRAAAEQVALQAELNAPGDSAGVTAACDSLTHGLLIVGRESRVVYANGAAAVMLGRRREDVADAPFEQVFQDESIRAAVAEASRDGAMVRRVVEVSRGEPGKDPDAELRVTVRSAETGPDRYATVLVEDITQQRLADRSRNAFVAQATHELRTPLTNIRLYVEQAVDEGDDDPALRAQALNVINSEARRLERVVSDMLSVAEIEAGSLSIRPGDVRTDALFEDLRSDYAAQASEKTIELVFDLPPKMPVIVADRDRLGQAIHNIVGNAIKYTPPGGRVKVRVDAPESGGLTVEVTDSGIGIDPDECERIFDRFYRANDRRIAHVTGSGLGLAIAREIARLHGGDITVDSQINEGSVFTISLPGADQDGPRGSARRAA